MRPSSCFAALSGWHARALVAAALVAGVVLPAWAQPPEPGPLQQPAALTRKLSLDGALRIFRSRNLDLLLSEAAVVSAEGDLLAASAVQNPQIQVGWGHVWNYRPDGKAPVLGPCITCANDGATLLISDQAAIENTLSNKRGLRRRAAKAALEAAKMQRSDGRRTLEFQVKSQYAQAVAATGMLGFARETQQFSARLYEISQLRHPGVLNDGQIARIEADKLHADIAVTAAESTLDGALAVLGFLLGQQTPDRAYEVDAGGLTYKIPAKLVSLDASALFELALANRPDLKAFGYGEAAALAQRDLARRQLVPDMALGMQYAEIGSAQNTAAPPQLTISLTTTLPIFYQQQGEVRRAEAAIATQKTLQQKAVAQIAADIRSALANLRTAKRTMDVMEAGLLATARRARDITDLQFKEGSAALTDLLDAQRQYVAAMQEYLQDLSAYWIAVFALEQATGVDLRN
jgi:outer membrane protein, heavy metal efflux system